MADHPPFELHSRRLGALPVVDLFLQRAGLERVLARHLPPADRRIVLPAAAAIGLLVRNLCLAREPLYGLREWAERCDPGLLGLGADESRLLNDDRVAGRWTSSSTRTMPIGACCWPSWSLTRSASSGLTARSR